MYKDHDIGGDLEKVGEVGVIAAIQRLKIGQVLQLGGDHKLEIHHLRLGF